MRDRKPEVRSQKSDGPLSASVEVRIEELVLHGFPPGDRHRIGEAVERELSRMFSEQGVPFGMVESRGIDQSDGGSFRTTPRSTGGVIGKQIAQAVYGGLRQ